ncbi:hypothetical protein SmJEL517_g03833 [Synchytrium microbalum]|uniref:Carboxylesterase type B domain-containing protein n=1 Tax=Synchytrium microbalum TaxID=1806994 RepID=A0A507C6Q7_9FUNG|nr:uncharacterized protein SmJEL517_g03833 [Synchytrium microbalum]TPX33165.1 hypothetical protein SmJEL517_g03833 [Synchytrium microbalum]
MRIEALLIALVAGHVSNVLASGPASAAASVTSTSTSNGIILDYGTLFGKNSPDGTAKLWLGIPYAAPPVGALRFKPPAAPQNLGNSFQATSFGNWCPQDPVQSIINIATPTQSEDCLTLNVYAPVNSSSNSSLPVMVFIHGGSYDSGSGGSEEYNGTNLIKNSPTPVIVVTFNYRLGVLGYLSSQELLDDGSTNPGMLDQVAAFTWVKKYIGAFGGDSTRITAFGESAGAQSIGAHLISYGGNQTIFGRAILESGSTLSGPLPMANSANSNTAFNAIASYVNCNTSTSKVNCMRNVTWQAMYNAQSTYQQTLNSVVRIGLFTPVVDGKYILTKPTAAVTQGLFSKTPIMLGTNSQEGTLFVPGSVDLAEQFYNASYALSLFVQSFSSALPAGSANTVLSLYPVSSYNNSAVRAAGDIFADLAFTCPAMNLSRAMTAAGVPVYKYRFNQLLLQAQTLWARDGVFHSTELPFVFATGIAPSELPLSQTIIGFWTRFAATGNPNGGNATWPVYAAGGPQIVLQSSTLPSLSTESDPSKDAQCAFWQSPSIQPLVDH